MIREVNFNAVLTMLLTRNRQGRGSQTNRADAAAKHTIKLGGVGELIVASSPAGCLPCRPEAKATKSSLIISSYSAAQLRAQLKKIKCVDCVGSTHKHSLLRAGLR